MPSIIVGVIVVGILTAGVVATVFGVIPWAQDRAAKADLSAVVMAQESARAMSAGSGAGEYQGKAGLVSAGVLSGTVNFKTITGESGGCYIATARSSTGKVYWADSDDSSAKEYTSGEESGCADLRSIAWAPVMVSTWSVEAGKKLTLPLAGKVNVSIDWGDGTPAQNVTTDNPSRTFVTSNSEQIITIEGTFNKWSPLTPIGIATNAHMLSVDEWGETGTTDLGFAFSKATNLRHVESIPTTTRTLDSAFAEVRSNFTFGDLDTSNVTDMSSMFYKASAFNQPVNFNTSRVKYMGSMFMDAAIFNQPLGFDTSEVIDMDSMFLRARAFNNLLPFNTSNVKFMGSMFSYATAFNQDLSIWRVGSVLDSHRFSYGASEQWSTDFKPKFG